MTGSQVRNLRERAGLSHEDFARALGTVYYLGRKVGFTPRYVRSMEEGPLSERFARAVERFADAKGLAMVVPPQGFACESCNGTGRAKA
jgi:transcriptional regulator with XRE-family HTH domain